MSGENVTLDTLPHLLTTDDFASVTRTDVESARHQIRKHSEILRPFKLGRETRIERENFETYYSLLTQGKIN